MVQSTKIGETDTELGYELVLDTPGRIESLNRFNLIALLKKQKPLNQGLRVLRVTALLCRTGNHSHSIVAGGLPEMSYTTRLMPRTSLMMRFDTLPSKLCGKCAHCAVMKSSVCTARSATTYS